MTLASYTSFAAVALVVVLIPGADFAVTLKNTVVGGRGQGVATAIGVSAACAVQGVAAVLGLAAIIVASQPVFTAIAWAGVAYLVFLAVQAGRSAWRGEYPAAHEVVASRGTGFRQGFLSNITNPKVMVFYLAVLPHFLVGGMSWSAVPFALTHAVLAGLYLTLIAAVIASASGWLQQRRVRRTLDGITAVVLGGFAGVLARSHL